MRRIEWLVRNLTDNDYVQTQLVVDSPHLETPLASGGMLQFEGSISTHHASRQDENAAVTLYNS